MMELPASDIERLIAPWVHAEVGPQDPRWIAAAGPLPAMAKRARRRTQLLRLIGRARGQKDVHAIYQHQIWPANDFADLLDPNADSTPVVWGKRLFLAGKMATKRVHLALLMNAIETVSPDRVLEVGSGAGLNVLVLAARFPDIEFVGAELSEAGVAAANIVAAEGIPPILAAFSPEPVKAAGPLGNVRSVEADASALPFTSGEFDLVFSAHALEQMEEVRHSALAEMARVSGGYVAMIEPFSDWNADGLRRNMILAKRYFQGSIADLKNYGLTVEHVNADIPAKLTMGMGFSLCHKA
jgi:ubiquinone/menaquinone biosynthesis C-methylase UbiE